ncbi:Gfo/Idh/MocA family protein [Shouchella shacheensis]|uniref:Gfo/Idh/MocA family protein n=1 Tax=Shouchella shacheensis TaxID=1649580 RepID=UPI00073FEA8C|nr:Gfo/Idh/MocA family oxidoreductase [Shouchella shacheensis]
MEQQVHVGFIGAGGIAQAHLKNVAANPKAKIVAISDISPQAVEAQSEVYEASAYTDAYEMLEAEKLDAVFLSIPPFAHGTLEEDIVAKGIHLFVEKPVELDLEQAKKKWKVIEESGVLHASGYCLRYWDVVQKAKDFLQGRDVALVRGHYLTSFVETPWYRLEDKSGGQLVEQSTHILDLFRYLGGEIVEVSGHMALQVSQDIEGITIPDVTAVTTRFASGAIGQLSSTFIQSDHRMGVELMGRGFRVTLEGGTLTIVDNGEKEVFESEVDFYEVQDAAFIEAVQKKEAALILASYEEGMKTLEATLAAKQSNKEGKVVTLNHIRV